MRNHFTRSAVLKHARPAARLLSFGLTFVLVLGLFVPAGQPSIRAAEAPASFLAAHQETTTAVSRFDDDLTVWRERAELSGAFRDELTSSPPVAPTDSQPQAPAPMNWADLKHNQLAAPLGDISVQDVSSVIFAQVYSPFVWGHASIGGLSVDLTLESSTGITKGIASQVCPPGPGKAIKIDATQLYYETVFLDPGDCFTPVMITPGDRIHVITSGFDPSPPPGATKTEDKRVTVDDIRAWTSYEQDSVGGTAPPGSQVIVTAGASGSVSLSQYLTPGSSVTYAELTAGPDGSFSTSTFRTSTDPTYKKISLQQGSTGFVRVRHSDGNEVYTVHGQNVVVLENSSTMHGYAFSLPSAPGGLQTGVVVSRPSPKLTITLKSGSGVVKETANNVSGGSPYLVGFSSVIDGGDIIDFSINQGPTTTVTTVPITARVDLGANQLTGTGPVSMQMVLGVGHIAGYISSTSGFDYLQKRVTTDGSGNYASNQFQCGATNYLSLQPGSFGTVGYEDAHGNFIYMAFAAPTNHIMSDYPFLEGWVADGTVRPTITVRDSNGVVKYSSTATPLRLYLSGQKLYVNTYYQMVTSQFIVPGDTVSVVSGSQTFTIPVDKVTAYVNTDLDTINGEAPAGATVRVVPAGDRSARREAVADVNGQYSAVNPYTVFNFSNCTESTKTEDFTPGSAGRAYVRHSDGSEVFTLYGRSMHVNQNENYLELYLYATRDLDWFSVPQQTVTVTLTPKQGSPVSVYPTTDGGRPGKTRVYINDTFGQKVLIRAGDSILANFLEGVSATTRQVSMTMTSLPLITGSPDIDTSTVAGVGPQGWGGTALLNSPPSAKPVAIPPGSYTAYSPIRFYSPSNSPITLVPGYSGIVSFSDNAAHRIWAAWAVTSYQVKITGWLNPGDTRVCGKAPPGNAVRIHDVTTETQDIVIGTGGADSQGNFCVTVSPLYKGQVVMAESNGTFSQPVVVGGAFQLYLPYITH